MSPAPYTLQRLAPESALREDGAGAARGSENPAGSRGRAGQTRRGLFRLEHRLTFVGRLRRGGETALGSGSRAGSGGS